ncbi:MAG: PD-(D/E)XK nuclease family protein [Defluviitaleaceae bacterium]|nr:PD-(D/E)XK nuclease family protein [Defluviitaleaceae bacterium]
MSLQFIFGPPGSGKTSLCLSQIDAAIQQEHPIPLYYLVPEQFSLQSEKLLLVNRAATTRVQVLSFNRLAYRLFALLGGPTGQVADDLGKTMVLRKVLLEIADDMIFYRRGADKQGFVESLATTITELNHYCIGSEDLRLRSKNLGPVLGAKLQDLSLITARYRNAVKGRYILADDMLDLLVQKLAEENEDIPLLKGAQIWADGFTGFTPQERQVLVYLMKQGADIKITLTARDTPDSLFATPRQTQEKLTALAKSANITVNPPIHMKENYRHAHSPGLAYFVHNFSMRPTSPGDVVNKSEVEILSAPDRYNAVYAAAHRILTWVNSGYRYRDIAIVCGDRSHYEKTLQTAFDRLGIPLFVDTEVDILAHPLTELIRSALTIFIHNWSYESVFRFLKTRLTSLDADTIDILENYALAHGITGFKWQYDFGKGPEDGRLHLLDALKGFGTGQTKDTVRGFSEKIFRMLYDLEVPETLQRWFDLHMAAGDPATARIHKQIWPKICQVFDKLVEVLGDEKVSLDSFASILDAGLAQVGLGRIPPTVDQVVLGDISRSRYPQIKAMLVLGANEGSLPPITPSPGLFTEDERIQLINSNIELAPDNLSRINEQYYALYCTFSQPSQNLSFIYAEGEPRGKVLRPSFMLKRLQNLFPGLTVQKAPILKEYDSATKPSREAPTILDAAKDIYGTTISTAASRLEAFARCPFAYFMNYLLEIKPRKLYQVLPTDLGTLYHDILAEFTNNIAQGRVDINSLNRSAIGNMVEKMIQEQETNLFHGTARNRHILNKVQGICTASIWALTEHIKRGSFTPLGAELDFGHSIDLKDGRSLELTGRIDRVDILKEKNGEDYLRIIDFKSGKTRFDGAEVAQGLQLQLMLYMNALSKEMAANPAGVFYFPLDNPIIDFDADIGENALDEALLRQFKLSGVTVEGDNILEGMDKGLAPGIDSPVIPVKLNKDGRPAKTATPQILTQEDFKSLAQAAEDKAKELGQRMAAGDIEANPCPKGVKAPCRYCRYGAICKSGIN